MLQPRTGVRTTPEAIASVPLFAGEIDEITFQTLEIHVVRGVEWGRGGKKMQSRSTQKFLHPWFKLSCIFSSNNGDATWKALSSLNAKWWNAFSAFVWKEDGGMSFDNWLAIVFVQTHTTSRALTFLSQNSKEIFPFALFAQFRLIVNGKTFPLVWI